jgi:hypothetical protein
MAWSSVLNDVSTSQISGNTTSSVMTHAAMERSSNARCFMSVGSGAGSARVNPK